MKLSRTGTCIEGDFDAKFDIINDRAIGEYWNREPYEYPPYGIQRRSFNVMLRGKNRDRFQVGGDSFKRTFKI